MQDDRTTIWISDELWKELNSRKERGDSFEDVIWRALEDGGSDVDPPEQTAQSPDDVAASVADAMSDVEED